MSDLPQEDQEWLNENVESPSEQPEAPASVTIKGYYKGFSVLITNRDPKVSVSPLLAKAINGINWMVENGFKPSWNDNTNGNALKKEVKTQGCPKCGGTRTLREGISAKTGKKWSGWFCSNPECKPEFVNYASKK